METRIRNLLTGALVTMALAIGASRAADLPRGTVLEGSVETSTGMVIFPAESSGRLQVRDCGGCLLSTIQTDAGTRYILVGETVSLRDMAQFALRNPGLALTIHYRLKDSVASRVTVLSR